MYKFNSKIDEEIFKRIPLKEEYKDEFIRKLIEIETKKKENKEKETKK